MATKLKLDFSSNRLVGYEIDLNEEDVKQLHACDSHLIARIEMELHEKGFVVFDVDDSLDLNLVKFLKNIADEYGLVFVIASSSGWDKVTSVESGRYYLGNPLWEKAELDEIAEDE